MNKNLRLLLLFLFCAPAEVYAQDTSTPSKAFELWINTMNAYYKNKNTEDLKKLDKMTSDEVYAPSTGILYPDYKWLGDHINYHKIWAGDGGCAGNKELVTVPQFSRDIIEILSNKKIAELFKTEAVPEEAAMGSTSLENTSGAYKYEVVYTFEPLGGDKENIIDFIPYWVVYQRDKFTSKQIGAPITIIKKDCAEMRAEMVNTAGGYKIKSIIRLKDVLELEKITLSEDKKGLELWFKDILPENAIRKFTLSEYSISATSGKMNIAASFVKQVENLYIYKPSFLSNEIALAGKGFKFTISTKDIKIREKKMLIPFTETPKEEVKMLPKNTVTILKTDSVTVVKKDPVTILKTDPVTIVKKDPGTILKTDSVTVVKKDSVTILKTDSVTVVKKDPEPVNPSIPHHKKEAIIADLIKEYQNLVTEMRDASDAGSKQRIAAAKKYIFADTAKLHNPFNAQGETGQALIKTDSFLNQLSEARFIKVFYDGQIDHAPAGTQQPGGAPFIMYATIFQSLVTNRADFKEAVDNAFLEITIQSDAPDGTNAKIVSVQRQKGRSLDAEANSQMLAQSYGDLSRIEDITITISREKSSDFWEEQEKTIEAIFKEQADIEVSSLGKSGARTQSVRKYLKNLESLKSGKNRAYDEFRLSIDPASVRVYARANPKISGRSWTGSISYLQKFEGIKNGVPVYGDQTYKKLDLLTELIDNVWTLKVVYIEVLKTCPLNEDCILEGH